LLTFTVSVSGIKDVTPVFAAYNLPEGAKFDTKTGVFTWTPKPVQVGVYEGIRFEAVVGDVVLSEEITITVMEVNTPAGQNIEVTDKGTGAAITFDYIETPGNTTITVYDELPEEILSGANMLPVFYDIETNAEFKGKARIKVKYDIAGYEINENDLRLFQLKDGKTTDITDPVNPGAGGNPDTKMKTIEGVVEHFCFFGIGVPNRAPVANAGQDRVIETKSDKGVQIVLDGSLSYDPDASLKGLRKPDFTPDGRSIVSYKWTGPFGEAEGVNPTVNIPAGKWECTLTVSDGWLESTDTVTIHVKKATDYGNSHSYERDVDDDSDRADENYSHFPYAVFSGSNDVHVSIYGSNIEIDGNLHTNNNLLFHGFSVTVDGICKSSGEIVALGKYIDLKTKAINAEPVKMPELTGDIKEKALKIGKHYYMDKSFSDDKVNLETPIVVNGSLSVNCTDLTVSETIFSSGSIYVDAAHCKGSNDKSIVICSENGDIVINGRNIELNGLIYAPKGTVVIYAKEFTLNGSIVANNVLIRGSRVKDQKQNND